MQKRRRNRWLITLLILALVAWVPQSFLNAESDDVIVNIGMSDPISSINPVNLDATEVARYAQVLAYDPIVELNQDLEMVPILAESVTTEDNQTFVVKLREEAKWSDGEPITADDVIFTVKKLTSRDLANPSMSTWYGVKGFGDDGFLDEGVEEVEGMYKEDDKTVVFVTHNPVPLVSFENTYLRYLLPVPSHILGDRDSKTLQTDPWFLAPEVVSGPYFPTSFDSNNHVTYQANENYWRGAPVIPKVNIRVLQGSQILTALQSGDIDFVQQTTGNVPQADYEAIEELENVTVNYGQPVTNETTFINTENVPDVRVRQAILHAIDRELLLEQLLRGQGAVIDGFTTTGSPYYDGSLEPVAYDPDLARELLEEAEWDGSQTLSFKINSGDPTYMQAANVIEQQLREVGIDVEIQTLDIGNLLADVGSGDYDIFSVQYTVAPVDPYPDVIWLVGGDGQNWPRYANEELTALIEETQTTDDLDELIPLYRQIDEILQEEVPMFSSYVISALGAVNNRLENAVPDVYGSFINIHEWSIAE